MMERSKEELQKLVEQSAQYGKQLLQDKSELEREIEDLREKHLQKEDDFTQQIFDLKRKLEIANNTVLSLQEDAADKSLLQRRKEEEEIEKLKTEFETTKLGLEEKLRNAEFEADTKDGRILALESGVETKQKLLDDLKRENESLTLQRTRLSDEEEEAATRETEALKAQVFNLKQEAAEAEVAKSRMEEELRRTEHALQEAEMEKECLNRKMVSCEKDVTRLKEDIVGLEQLLENEKLNQKSADSRGNSLFGELDDQRKKAEEAFELMKNRYTQSEEKCAKLRNTNKRLNTDVQNLLVATACGKGIGEKEYDAIKMDLKNMRRDKDELDNQILQLRGDLVKKEETIERLKAEALSAKTEAPKTGSDDPFIQYYKDCVERQKEKTADMEKKWKGEMMEKLLCQDENTKLKFEMVTVKRESQRQKTENYKLTMKIEELKSQSDSGGQSKEQQPPPKKQRVVFEKMPEEWKINSGSPKTPENSFKHPPLPSDAVTPSPISSLPSDSSILAPKEIEIKDESDVKMEDSSSETGSVERPKGFQKVVMNEDDCMTEEQVQQCTQQ